MASQTIPFQRQPLTQNWTFKNTSPASQGPPPNARTATATYLPTAQFPTTIHLDLLHHNLIPDPFLDSNEGVVQWVGEESWTYRTFFASPSPSPSSSQGQAVKSELVFEGLDTHCTVFLNGKEILKTENMYLEYRVDVSGLLIQQAEEEGKQGEAEKENELVLVFESTFLLGREMEKQAVRKPLFCHNGDWSRLQVRKAPYSYGWDWGPIMLTCGPWRPIYLETYTTRIADLHVQSEVAPSLDKATVNVAVDFDGPSLPNKVKFEVLSPQGNPLQEKIVTVEKGSKQVKSQFEIQSPELWYPNGNGAQPLYTVTAIALSAEQAQELCSETKRIGLRRLELVQKPLEKAEGTSFFFRINNIPIFSRGSDWIPSDMFLPRITPAKYRRIVELVAQGHQNMIRVWGGGIYEDDSFYEACDELGIMVWQDFMLGCGDYPVVPEFLKLVEEEVVYNLKRMRHHVSIVVWCGNNEDHMFADAYTNGGYNPDDLDEENWLKSNWPARIIYDKILPKICKELVPETPYHPGSPWGGRPSNDTRVGDVHAWDVWMKASKQYPYQRYPELAGRFVSEFGVKSYPTLKTVLEWTTDPNERHPQSRAMDAHMKSSSKSTWARDNRTIALYLIENLRHGFKLHQYVYASMLIQAEAMQYAYSGWRRLWKGPENEECAGALVWQLNDAWPCISWSLIDFHLRPKFSYYSIKRAIAPITVGVAREEVELGRDGEFTAVHIRTEKRLRIWGSNFTVNDREADLVVSGIDVASGKSNWEKKIAVRLPQNQSTELLDELLPAGAEQTIFLARLFQDGKIVARFVDWPQPLRHLDLPKVDLKLKVENDSVHISTDLPVKGLVLYADDDSVYFEDNCFDVIPGDDQVIQAKGLNGRAVTFMHLGLAVD